LIGIAALSRALSKTPLAYFPVRVRSGLAKGAKWTLLPFSNNWRHGGDSDVPLALRWLPIAEATCWDFGAHFGIFTVGLAMQVGSGGQVAAFEPDPHAFARLRYHVGINKLTNVRLFCAAASDRDGIAHLNTTFGSATSFIQERGNVQIATVTPDSLVRAGKISAPRFIKCDVEGHGHLALKGSCDSIVQTRPVILFECHSGEELSVTRDVLLPLNYRRIDLNGRRLAWDDETITTILLPD
jgi:FkbM family methyltransferase